LLSYQILRQRTCSAILNVTCGEKKIPKIVSFSEHFLFKLRKSIILQFEEELDKEKAAQMFAF